MSATSDNPNLANPTRLVPLMKLAENAGLTTLAEEYVRLPSDKGANARAKIFSLVADILARAVSIYDVALLLHAAKGKVLLPTECAVHVVGHSCAPSIFGRVNQLEVASSNVVYVISGGR